MLKSLSREACKKREMNEEIYPVCPNVEIVSWQNEEVPKSGHRVAILDNILYVVGGFNPDARPAIRNEIRRYDIFNQKWLDKATGV